MCGRRALLVAKDKNPKISKAYSKTIQIKAESSPLLSYQSLLQMLKNDSCISSRTIHIIKVKHFNFLFVVKTVGF
uniref:Uncharacterized protein n=1 Tax=Helianthus annuus TaxID=4232 RepID=A0A251T9N4_HELAN